MSRPPNLKHSEKFINCQLNNLVITPLTCSAFIIEFVKFIVYEKVQIPYPYSWLKTKVTKRQNLGEDRPHRNLMVERQFGIAATAFQFIEDLSRHLHKEFKDNNSLVEEVVISFGATATCPKEVYSITLPKRTGGHSEANHLSDMDQTVKHMLRSLVLTPEWFGVTDNAIPPTNMHVLMRKRSLDTSHESDFFLPKDVFRIPTNADRININFDSTQTKQHLCCSYLQVFQDSIDHKENKLDQSSVEICKEFIEDGEWFQAKSCLKGFKDININNKSVSNLW